MRHMISSLAFPPKLPDQKDGEQEQGLASVEERERLVCDQAKILFDAGDHGAAKQHLLRHHPGGERMARLVFGILVRDNDPERRKQAELARAELAKEQEAEAAEKAARDRGLS